MGLALAFKRVSRLYGSSIRRNVCEVAQHLFFFAAGLLIGLYHNASPEFHERVTFAGIIIFLSLGAVMRLASPRERAAR